MSSTAAKNAVYGVAVPFTPGRTDASQEQTDVESFAVLERLQTASVTTSNEILRIAEELLVDRAQLLTADRS